MPYVKSVGVFDCPDDSMRPASNFVNGIQYTLSPVSYAYNENIAVPSGTRGVLAGFTAPASTVLLTEITGNANSQPMPWENVADLSTQNEAGGSSALISIYSAVCDGINLANHATPLLYATGYMGGPERARLDGWGRFFLKQGRHSGGANFLLCDGHVKWLMGSKISTGPMVAGCPSVSTDKQNQRCFDEPAGTQSTESWSATYSTL